MLLNHFVCKSSFKLRRKQLVAVIATLKRWCAVELHTAKQRTGERITKPVSLRQSVTKFFCLLYAFMLWPERKTPESLILSFESERYFLDKLLTEWHLPNSWSYVSLSLDFSLKTEAIFERVRFCSSDLNFLGANTLYLIRFLPLSLLCFLTVIFLFCSK